MARAHFVKRANKPIYAQGKRVNYVSPRGKNEGKTLSKIDVTLPANSSDKIIVQKGESYYWWQFKGGSKNYSRTQPKPSQLTRSSYLSTLYDIQDRLSSLRGNVSGADDLFSAVDEIKGSLQELLDETQGSLDNMPEQLQEGSILNERVETLENAISELEDVDLDYEEPDEDSLKDEAREELGYEDNNEEDEEEEEEKGGIVTDEDVDARVEEMKEEKLSEWLDEKCEEISNVTIE